MLKFWLLFALALPAGAFGALPEWPSEGQAQVCDAQARPLYQALGAGSPTLMDVYYFDTPTQEARARGVYLRLRVEGDEAQVTLKWRQQDLQQRPDGADCELDVTREHATPSCSWGNDVELNLARSIVKGETPVAQLLNSHQWDVYRQLMRDGSTAGMEAYGPVHMERRKIPGPEGLKWRLETWPITDQQVVFEVSYRDGADVAPEQVRQKMDRYFQQKWLTRCAVENSKTDMVLDSRRHPLSR